MMWHRDTIVEKELDTEGVSNIANFLSFVAHRSVSYMRFSSSKETSKPMSESTEILLP
jgi:hypothetical protein